MHNLLQAAYPIGNFNERRVFEEYAKDSYRCNVCERKLFGQLILTAHNRDPKHQQNLQICICAAISAMEKSMHHHFANTIRANMRNVYFTLFFVKFLFTDLMRKNLEKNEPMFLTNQAALEYARKSLNDQIAELKRLYRAFEHCPPTHPMYLKEWQVFYLRRSSELIACKCPTIIFLG